MAATQEEIDRVVAAYENAKNAADYAETLVVEMRLNKAQDYTMVWTVKNQAQT